MQRGLEGRKEHKRISTGGVPRPDDLQLLRNFNC